MIDRVSAPVAIATERALTTRARFVLLDPMLATDAARRSARR
ncbi:hypothetical protein FBY39_1831 [Microbacterium sp. SLBN-146]|nr:hypothetical protein FBY39_1831 [Microbacterium sp. SLBN-146]